MLSVHARARVLYQLIRFRLLVVVIVMVFMVMLGHWQRLARYGSVRECEWECACYGRVSGSVRGSVRV